MTSIMFFRALLTGGFCAVFALGVDLVADQLTVLQLMAVAAISGFCGSIFAHFVLRSRSANGQ